MDGAERDREPGTRSSFGGLRDVAAPGPGVVGLASGSREGARRRESAERWAQVRRFVWWALFLLQAVWILANAGSVPDMWSVASMLVAFLTLSGLLALGRGR
jgi:hypothetical protein